jgi:hypothetical protein
MEKDWKKRLPLSFKKTAFKRRCEYKRMLCFVFDETRNKAECPELSRLLFTCYSKNMRHRGVKIVLLCI